MIIDANGKPLQSDATLEAEHAAVQARAGLLFAAVTQLLAGHLRQPDDPALGTVTKDEGAVVGVNLILDMARSLPFEIAEQFSRECMGMLSINLGAIFRDRAVKEQLHASITAANQQGMPS